MSWSWNIGLFPTPFKLYPSTPFPVEHDPTPQTHSKLAWNKTPKREVAVIWPYLFNPTHTCLLK